MTPVDLIVLRSIAGVAIIFAALWSLGLLLCREWVKSDLRARSLEPLSVRWRPFANWGGFYGYCFLARFADVSGVVREGRCWTGGFKRGVTWYSDTNQ